MGGSGRRSSRSNRAGEVQGQGEGDGSIVRYRDSSGGVVCGGGQVVCGVGASQ